LIRVIRYKDIRDPKQMDATLDKMIADAEAGK